MIHVNVMQLTTMLFNILQNPSHLMKKGIWQQIHDQEDGERILQSSARD